MRSDNLGTVSTGIRGLDDVLMGGLPANRVYLLEGNPGSGKTSLAIKFLLEGVRLKEPCLYVALSESISEIESVADSHGWDLTGVEIFELASEQELDGDAQNTFFYSSEIELGETNEVIMKAIERVRPKRVVFDSLSELKLLAQDPMKFRRQVMALKRFFLKQGATVLLLDDKTASSDLELQSIVHGVIRLEQLAPEYGAERRRLKVTKLRGLSYRGGYHDFMIRKGGPVVFPRLIAAEHGSLEVLKGIVPSGIPELDRLVGGGIDRGTSTLLMGPAGSGKSSIAIQYAVTAAERGEHSAIFAFDEGIRTMISRSMGMGCDLKKHLDSGLISVKQIDPAELSPGEFSHLVRESVDLSKAKLIIIDSLNGYLKAMPEERFLVIQMHELLSYLGQMGIATFLIVAQHGLVGAGMDTVVDISYLADNVLLHRYFESTGSVRQALSVVKRRSGPHERSIRELTLTSSGPRVGEPLTSFQGVLSGIPKILNGNYGV
jgi:circadian clock protein KaiC